MPPSETEKRSTISDMIGPFDGFEAHDVRKLITDYPFAWMYLPHRGDALPIELPMIGEYGDDGTLQAVIGHFGRRNPVHAVARASPHARFLFRGPDAYVSPQHAGTRDWAPTWNYAHLIVDAEVTVDEAMTDRALAILVDAMEKDRANPWSVSEIGARYDILRQAIIGFRAEVTALSGRFKLGQDERPEVLRAILASHPDETLVTWMRAANAGRL